MPLDDRVTREPAAATRCPADAPHEGSWGHYAGPHAECPTPERCCPWEVIKHPAGTDQRAWASVQFDAHVRPSADGETWVTQVPQLGVDAWLDLRDVSLEALRTGVRDALAEQGWVVERVRLDVTR